LKRKNPYVGINAHLNSLLQTSDTDDQPSLWRAFHISHLTGIADALDTQFPRDYITMIEPSLQLLEAHDDPTKPLKAVVIRELLAQGKLGKIVTRIELLSPSNKLGGGHFDAYAVKRVDMLESGVPLIEIDYLHELPPIVSPSPRYPDQQGAFPYWIIVSDPRPNWQDGTVQGFGFHVGEAIKPIPVPLAGSEILIFDLNAVYQHTFKAGRWGDLLDYAREPERFHTYSADDQARIRAAMESVANTNESNGTANGRLEQ
jgi:hypothetical protein